MQSLNVEPLWDEGIASFLATAYENKQQPLGASDLQQFATEQAVRVGDLLETLFLMVIYGAWHYCDAQGNEQQVNETALDELYAKGRIGPDDMKEFDGVWIPAV